MADCHRSNQYYRYIQEVTSKKSNYKMVVYWLLLIISTQLTHLQYVNIERNTSF